MYVADWNISLNQLLDTSGYLHESNVKNRGFVRDMITEKELTDLWREQNIDKFEYSWSKNEQMTWFFAHLLEYYILN